MRLTVARLGQRLVNETKALKGNAAESSFVFADGSLKSAAVKQPDKANDPGAFGWVITTREEFKQHWPKVYAKQEWHLHQIRDNHLPVHLSGKNSNVFVTGVYGMAAVMLCTSIYFILSFTMK